MINQRFKNHIAAKICSMVVVCVFFVNSMPVALPPHSPSATSTLAAQHIFNALRDEGIEVSAQLRYKIITGFLFLCDGWRPRFVNTTLNQVNNYTTDGLKVEFDETFADSEGKVIAAKFYVEGKENRLFKISRQNGEITIEKDSGILDLDAYRAKLAREEGIAESLAAAGAVSDTDAGEKFAEQPEEQAVAGAIQPPDVTPEIASLVSRIADLALKQLASKIYFGIHTAKRFVDERHAIDNINLTDAVMSVVSEVLSVNKTGFPDKAFNILYAYADLCAKAILIHFEEKDLPQMVKRAIENYLRPGHATWLVSAGLLPEDMPRLFDAASQNMGPGAAGAIQVPDITPDMAQDFCKIADNALQKITMFAFGFVNQDYEMRRKGYKKEGGEEDRIVWWVREFLDLRKTLSKCINQFAREDIGRVLKYEGLAQLYDESKKAPKPVVLAIAANPHLFFEALLAHFEKQDMARLITDAHEKYMSQGLKNWQADAGLRPEDVPALLREAAASLDSGTAGAVDNHWSKQPTPGPIEEQVKQAMPRFLEALRSLGVTSVAFAPDGGIESEHGKSFIRLTPDAAKTLDIAQKEKDEANLFYRGTNDLKYIKQITSKGLINDRAAYDRFQGLMVYSMLHGFEKVPVILKGAFGTVRARLHFTMFMQKDGILIPGSSQYQLTSGHYQGNLIDIKVIAKGRGVQYLPRINSEGRLVAARAIYVDADNPAARVAFALPGDIDIFYALEPETAFFDISLEVSPEQAKRIFNVERAWAFNPKEGETFVKNFPGRGAAHVIFHAQGKTLLGMNPDLPFGDKKTEPLTWVAPLNYPVFTRGMLHVYRNLGQILINLAQNEEWQRDIVERFNAPISDENSLKILGLLGHKVLGADEVLELTAGAVNISEDKRKAISGDIEQGGIFKFSIPNIRTGADGYTWGQPAMDSNILRDLGLRPADIGLGDEDIVAEYWICSDDPTYPSQVDIGGVRVSLRDILELYGRQILGDAHYGEYGPYLGVVRKFIDANLGLSVQLHPAPGYPGRPAKPECWKARPQQKNSSVLLGFRRTYTTEGELLESFPVNQDQEIAEKHRIEYLMNLARLEPGEMLDVPGGCPHAILGDAYVDEWSLASVAGQPDLKAATVSPWDRTMKYGHSGPSKAPRKDKEKREDTLKVLRHASGYAIDRVNPKNIYTGGPVKKVIAVKLYEDVDGNIAERLFTKPEMIVERFVIKKAVSIQTQGRGFPIYVNGGRVNILSPEGRLLASVSAGEGALIPASCEKVILASVGGAAADVDRWYATLGSEKEAILAGKSIPAPAIEPAGAVNVYTIPDEEFLSQYTGFLRNHVHNVRDIILILAREMGLSDRERELLRVAALTHDLGAAPRAEHPEVFAAMGQALKAKYGLTSVAACFREMMKERPAGTGERAFFIDSLKTLLGKTELTAAELKVAETVLIGVPLLSQTILARDLNAQPDGELTALIRFHNDYQAFVSALPTLSGMLSLDEASLSKLLTILMAADMIETGNNLTAQSQRNLPPGPFGVNFEFIEGQFQRNGITDMGAVDALRRVLVAEYAQHKATGRPYKYNGLIDIILRARKADDLTPGDTAYLESVIARQKSAAKRNVFKIPDEEFLDRYTGFLRDHVRNARDIILVLAREMGLSDRERELLRVAALAHDLGAAPRAEHPEAFAAIGQALRAKYGLTSVAACQRELMKECPAGTNQYEFFVDRIKSLLGKDKLTPAEVSVARTVFLDIPNLSYTILTDDMNAQLPEELAILIKYHNNYQAFLRGLSILSGLASVNEESLKNLIVILIAADMIETGNNLTAQSQRNLPPGPFGVNFEFIEGQFQRNGITDMGAVDALRRVLAAEHAEHKATGAPYKYNGLIDILLQSRKADALTPEDISFLDTISGAGAINIKFAPNITPDIRERVVEAMGSPVITSEGEVPFITRALRNIYPHDVRFAALGWRIPPDTVLEATKKENVRYAPDSWKGNEGKCAMTLRIPFEDRDYYIDIDIHAMSDYDRGVPSAKKEAMKEVFGILYEEIIGISAQMPESDKREDELTETAKRLFFEAWQAGLDFLPRLGAITNVNNVGIYALEHVDREEGLANLTDVLSDPGFSAQAKSYLLRRASRIFSSLAYLDGAPNGKIFDVATRLESLWVKDAASGNMHLEIDELPLDFADELPWLELALISRLSGPVDPKNRDDIYYHAFTEGCVLDGLVDAVGRERAKDILTRLAEKIRRGLNDETSDRAKRRLAGILHYLGNTAEARKIYPVIFGLSGTDEITLSRHRVDGSAGAIRIEFDDKIPGEITERALAALTGRIGSKDFLSLALRNIYPHDEKLATLNWQIPENTVVTVTPKKFVKYANDTWKGLAGRFAMVIRIPIGSTEYYVELDIHAMSDYDRGAPSLTRFAKESMRNELLDIFGNELKLPDTPGKGQDRILPAVSMFYEASFAGLDFLPRLGAITNDDNIGIYAMEHRQHKEPVNVQDILLNPMIPADMKSGLLRRASYIFSTLAYLPNAPEDQVYKISTHLESLWVEEYDARRMYLEVDEVPVAFANEMIWFDLSLVCGLTIPENEQDKSHFYHRYFVEGPVLHGFVDAVGRERARAVLQKMAGKAVSRAEISKDPVTHRKFAAILHYMGRDEDARRIMPGLFDLEGIDRFTFAKYGKEGSAGAVKVPAAIKNVREALPVIADLVLTELAQNVRQQSIKRGTQEAINGFDLRNSIEEHIAELLLLTDTEIEEMRRDPALIKLAAPDALKALRSNPDLCVDIIYMHLRERIGLARFVQQTIRKNGKKKTEPARFAPERRWRADAGFRSEYVIEVARAVIARNDAHYKHKGDLLLQDLRGDVERKLLLFTDAKILLEAPRMKKPGSAQDMKKAEEAHSLAEKDLREARNNIIEAEHAVEDEYDRDEEMPEGEVEEMEVALFDVKTELNKKVDECRARVDECRRAIILLEANNKTGPELVKNFETRKLLLKAAHGAYIKQHDSLHPGEKPDLQIAAGLLGDADAKAAAGAIAQPTDPEIRKRISLAHARGKNLRTATAQKTSVPVDFEIDLSLIYEPDLDNYIKEWALIMLLNKDLDVNLNFRASGTLSPDAVADSLVAAVGQYAKRLRIDLDLDAVRGRVNIARENAFRVPIIDERNLPAELSGNEYPVIMAGNIVDGKAPVWDFHAATELGKCYAALAQARQGSKYDELKGVIIQRMLKLYAACNVDVTEKELPKVLDNIVSGSAKDRLVWLRYVALPPIVRVLIENLETYHKAIRLLLESA